MTVDTLADALAEARRHWRFEDRINAGQGSANKLLCLGEDPRYNTANFDTGSPGDTMVVRVREVQWPEWYVISRNGVAFATSPTQSHRTISTPA